jgi:hypothetical protein
VKKIPRLRRAAVGFLENDSGAASLLRNTKLAKKSLLCRGFQHLSYKSYKQSSASY